MTATIRNWAQVYGELSIMYEVAYQSKKKQKKADYPPAVECNLYCYKEGRKADFV